MAAQLKLIVDNQEPRPVPIACTFEQAWAMRSGQMKTRGDGRDKTRALWVKAAKKVGSASLLGALRRYLDQKEPQCGFCGLSVWLNGQKYDHWLEATKETGSPTSEQKRFPSPHREALEKELGDGWIRSYLDPCTFHEDGWITPATEFARKKLLEKAKTLKACGLNGIRNKK